ncbi:unnamed protein product [Adineta ricciae]|uniref:Uncharacterized protein n=1 Tax=Adineta ricciae TaxID=249248 RepID=A0A814ZWY2_ADIRI|nr:unnamed protein product [Adineta ricciae]
MATICCKPKRTSNKVQNKESTYRLTNLSNDGDWSRAIHHDLNIKRRTCTTFIPKDKTKFDRSRSRSDVQCCCNRLHREHSWSVYEDPDIKWDAKLHTTSAYNNAYGYTPNSHANYIRCDMETDPKILTRLMIEVWKVQPPRLIMCIIGGAKYFKLNERLEREFMKGIIQAALKADGWIVTTGFKTGVVQLVGEAIHDHKVTNPRSKITAIGCSKWGATKNRESLVSSKPTSKESGNPSTTNGSKTEKKSEQELDPNHTHFLLLDDGTYYKYDTGDYRSRFVLDAARYRYNADPNSEQQDVPVVTIVVEGGPDTLLTIYKDLRQDIPIVLIDGSGRVPNLLTNFLIRTETMINRMGKEEMSTWKQAVDIKTTKDIERLKSQFYSYGDEICDGLKDISKGSKKNENFDELFHCILYCLQPAVRSRIRIYSLDNDRDLDDTIFEAIIHAKQEKSSDVSSRKQLLRLALAWDAIEVAKELIIKDDLSDFDEQSKSQLFIEALKRDRSQFINVFIKLNFDVTKIFYESQTNKPWKLKWKQLADIYKEEYTKDKERLYLLEKCNRGRPIEARDDLDRILKTVVGDYMKSTYAPTASGFWGRLLICCRCPQRSRVSDSRTILYTNDDLDETEVPNPEEAKKEARELALRDLFFWAVLTNRLDMAKVFLGHMQTRICAALIASKILKCYIEYARDNDSKDALSSEAEQFEDYAIKCLRFCYNYDESIACEIAIRRINIFGGVSCLQVAVDADDKNFVGQPCCDQLLNNVWYDKLDPYKTTLIRRVLVLISVCSFGLLAPLLVAYRKPPLDSENDGFQSFEKTKQSMTVNETQDETDALIPKRKQRLNDHGIHYSDNIISSSNLTCSKKIKLYFRRLKQFHESPYIKFLYNSASYIFFLLLFSYYLLFNFNPPTDDIPSINWTEILVIIMVTTMLLEDFRKFLCQENRSFMGKMQNYFIKDAFFSSIRVASYLLFYIGLILRFANASTPEEFSSAKIVLAYDLEIWYIRSLAFLGIAKNLGPKLVMIRRMVIDLSFFIYIIIVAMVAYGVASRAMYNFNADADSDDLTFDGRSIFRHIIYPSYYLMYGEVDGDKQALDQNPNDSTSIATHVLLAFHMLFVNILLINLLIAMFSFTFESVQTQTDLVWRYERYSFVREYFDRPPLFPPFILITHFFELCKLILRHLPCTKHPSSTIRPAKTFKMVAATGQIEKEWSEFESYSTNSYAQSIISGQSTSAVALVSSAARQDASSITLDALNFPQISPNFDIKSITEEISSIKKAVGDLRTYAEEMNRCMQWMMDAMERVRMSKDPKPRLRSAITTSDIQFTDE